MSANENLGPNLRPQTDQKQEYLTTSELYEKYPAVTLENGIICHNGIRCRVSIHRNRIRIACTTITPEAAKFILSSWPKHFETTFRAVHLQ